MSRLIVVSLLLLLLFVAPILTSAVAPALELDVAAAAAVESDGDEEMSFWDWCVLWWTTHIGEWPD